MKLYEELDRLFYSKDFAGAEEFLIKKSQEYAQNHEHDMELICYNELGGIYRKQNLREKTFWAIDKCIELIHTHGFSYSLLGDVYTSLATAYMHFAEHEKALPLFNKAEECYEYFYKKPNISLATLLNNKGLCLMAMGDTASACASFQKSIEILENLHTYPLELAMSLISLAEAKNNSDEDALYEKAAACFESVKQDGYYAFVAEKCLLAFKRAGYFRVVKTLQDRIDEINKKLANK